MSFIQGQFLTLVDFDMVYSYPEMPIRNVVSSNSIESNIIFTQIMSVFQYQQSISVFVISSGYFPNHFILNYYLCLK